MALYLGSDKVKVNLGSSASIINFYSTTFITNGALLLSSEGYILQDSNGTYLTAVKEAD